MENAPTRIRQRIAGLCVRCVCLAVAILLQGCGTMAERTPLPEEGYDDALVLGLPGLRFWGDEDLPLTRHLGDDSTLEEIQAILPAFVGQEVNFLAISGGGANGAFAAGLLNGWTSTGTRPEFTTVTGISTGALIAPFAYLGPDYDHVLERIYSQYSTSDLIIERSLLRSFLRKRDSAFDTAPLRERLAEYVDEAVMVAIANEYRRGRLLLIGTTNLDAGRPVVWDIGAIATSGKPGALDLIRDVILASASIPIAFPPVMIEVESGGEIYDEMHTDGGVSRQAFMFHLSMPEDSFETLNIIGQGNLYLIRNSQLEPSWQPVDRTMMAIAGRSAGALVNTQGVGDLYREFVGASKYGFSFNLAFIPSHFDYDAEELFDPGYMRALFELGYEMGANGNPWSNLPPGLEPK